MAQSTVKPALTQAEWEKWLAKRGNYVRQQYCSEAPSGWLTVDGFFTADDKPALAAVVLHGQPFGFTWDDVDLLRGVAAKDDAERAEIVHPGAVHLFPSPLHGLADRIKALLPPTDLAP